MSIIIQNDSLAGGAAPGVGRTDEISRPAGWPGQSTGRSDNRGGDSVDLSSLSQSVAAASTAQEAEQAGRISHLTALYRSGQYSIDSAQVGRAMVSHALGDGTSGQR
jgi:hypothetical protein